MLRLVEPTEGKVYLDGVDLMALRPRELRQARSKMQIIFQHPESSLDPRLKIRESLREPWLIQGIRLGRQEEKNEINRLVGLVGLNQEHLNRYPHQLSGGQVQRAVLARILALRPGFIVADEPTSMLDVSVQAQVLNLLKEVQGRFNIALLFISHDLEVVQWMSHRVAVMYRGDVVEAGPPGEVCQHPRHPYTRVLVKAFTGSGPGKHFPGSGQGGAYPGEGPPCSYYPLCPSASGDCKMKPKFRQVGRDHFVACHQREG